MTTSRHTPRRALEASALTLLSVMAMLLSACARMGQPDGGWYDETPPRVIGTYPVDRSANVRKQKVEIMFNEYVNIDNATENVIVSPPQLETPEIKSAGKKIVVELKDSLRENTTYTVDFSDAITDNNEKNPLGNYTYSFSTGGHIDTLEVSGHVLEAENLEPVKGILVGLYDNASDTAFTTTPFLRVARTDSRGRFVIKGVAPGTYRIYALKDADGDYRFSQKSEMIAWDTLSVTPSSFPDTRQDTIWADSLHIQSIARVPYTHFIPDNITLRAFTETLTDRYLLKSERKEADRFTLYFSYGSDSLPSIRGLNFDSRDAFVIEPSEKADTVTYWLRDTALINNDTLEIELRYSATDTLGVLRPQTDTLQLLSKQPYEKRMKQKQKDFETWQKKQEKKKKRGEPYDSIPPVEEMEFRVNAPSALDPDKNPTFEFMTPLARIDTAKLHLYVKHDTLWYNAPFETDTIGAARRGTAPYGAAVRHLRLRGEWRPGLEYSLEADSLAFTDIYGKGSKPSKNGIRVKPLDEYATLLLNIQGVSGRRVIVQLRDKSDKVVKQTATDNGTAEFFYLPAGEYYVSMFEDDNGNGVWDTGSYAEGRQPERVSYRREPIECKEKWDLTIAWNPAAEPVTLQKPPTLTKQKADKAKTTQNRNAERARKLGITYVPAQ